MILKIDYLKILLLVLLVLITAMPDTAAQEVGQDSTGFVVNLPDNLPQISLRKELCLNGEWEFKCHNEDEWTTIRVPGCYSICCDSDCADYRDIFGYPQSWTGQGAVYRRQLIIPDSMKNMNIRFHCGGCFYHGRVYINNKFAGEFHDGYFPFEFDIDRLVNANKNILEVVVDSTDGHTDGGETMANRGIWQDTYLNAYSRNITIGADFFIKTYVNNATIETEVPVINATDDSITFYIRHYITDAADTTVFKFDGGWQSLPPQSDKLFFSESHWENPRLWFPHDPYLYHIHTVLFDEQGRPVDKKTTRFGFREIFWRGTKLYINGYELYLRGHLAHYAGDLQGCKKYNLTWLTELKKYGINFLRLDSFPRHAALYHAADEVGILLECQPAFNHQLPEYENFSRSHVTDLITAYRNHPAVIIWSFPAQLFRQSEQLIDLARYLDPTRPVFLADGNGWSTQLTEEPEVMSDSCRQFINENADCYAKNESVWTRSRPLFNGSGGYEVSSQDYASGTWYDGYYLILQHHFQKNSTGFNDHDRDRTNGFIPVDLMHNFFRWQPINKNNGIELLWPDLTTPGTKGKYIPPAGSTLNLWDPQLPVLEPLPGFYVFKKLLQPVRFYDYQQLRTFFGGDQIVFDSKLIYEDLRAADEIRCMIETIDGEILWEEFTPFYIIPGEVVERLELYFDIPKVQQATAVRFIRQFYFENEPGYRDTFSAKIFPRFSREMIPGLDTLKIGLYQASFQLEEWLNELKIPFSVLQDNASSQADSFDLIFSTRKKTANDDQLVSNHIKGGGKFVSLISRQVEQSDTQYSDSGAFYSIDSDYRFTDIPHYLRGKSYIMTALDDMNYTVMPGDSTPDQFLTFNVNKPVTVYLGYDWRPMKLPLWLQSWTEHDERIVTNEQHMSFRLFSRSFPAGKITLGLNKSCGVRQMYTVIIADSSDDELPPLEITFLSAKSGRQYEIVYNGFHGTGRSQPAVRYLLNGAKHKILDGLRQEDFSFWNGTPLARNLSTDRVLPKQRIILAGDRDGTTAALYETMSGSGVAIFTTLNLIQDFQTEPVAGWMLRNILNYVNNYQIDLEPAKVQLFAGEQLKSFFDSLGLVYDNFPAPDSVADCLIFDMSQSVTVKKMCGIFSPRMIDNYTQRGGTVFLWKITPETIDAASELTGRRLRLTEPYLNEREHCVKAAISWTRRDTPQELVEYYDDVLIPQPFEPNYDPLLSGISNSDLHWEGQPMFDYGIEIEGMDRVELSDHHSILISNWQTDRNLSQKKVNYIHRVSDMRRASWFLNRDAVVLKISNGKGAYIICQLDIPKGGLKGRRLTRQLLTKLIIR